MAKRYGCPNPVCTHEFDPAELSGVASVTCPRCGMMIQLRAAPATAVAPQPDVAPAPPITAPAPAEPASPERDTSFNTPIVRARQAPKRRDWITYSVLIGLFLVLVGLGVGAAIQRMVERPNLLGGNEPMKNTDLNV